MLINFKELSFTSPDLPAFSRINNEAFPPSEHMDMSEILAFAVATGTDVLGIYDHDMPIGFAVIVKNDRCGYIYFYAIDSRLRSNSYGSAALQKLLEQYSGIQMTLDFESINQSAANNEQRIRRRAFYLRNGFHETGRCTMLRGELFEVVCSEDKLDEAGLKELLTVIHAHVPEFPAILL